MARFAGLGLLLVFPSCGLALPLVCELPLLLVCALALDSCNRGKPRAIDPASEPCSGPAGPSGSPACTQYDAPRDAFLRAIADKPIVLAVGEAHAPKGASAPSAAKRFTDEFLPLLAGRASDLLLELMMPPSGCVDAAAEARESQAPVTSQHADHDQDEYVAMGEKARSLGIVPDMLRPSCADMDAIAHANTDDMVDVSLTTIARLSLAQATRLVDRDALSDGDRGKMVVVYGGALHNALSPAPGTEAARWSFTPELARHVHGSLRVLELVVPEFIGDDETWRALPWWPVYEAKRQVWEGSAPESHKTRVLHTGDGAWWLIFPRTVSR